ncbi:MAG: hypothetical protein KIT84_13065 [Labilithrix sp.]|nr:hypothetical protein [Labilithrix sp.]MCW5811946.1 hypothetical protein [Labilithrix sp.]
MMTRAVLALALLGLSVVGCGGGGKYGYSPKYIPTDSEEAALKGARDYDPVMYNREPEVWRKGTVTLFGVVTARAPGNGGMATVGLSVRRLEPRNLCENGNDDDTCRVTVSDKDFGTVRALVPLKGEDDVGEHSVAVGSLLRVVGKIGEDVDESGMPVLRASFYRHWPRYFYVTRANAETMRQ